MYVDVFRRGEKLGRISYDGRRFRIDPADNTTLAKLLRLPQSDGAGGQIRAQDDPEAFLRQMYVSYCGAYLCCGKAQDGDGGGLGAPVSRVGAHLRGGKRMAIEEAFGTEPPGPGWIADGPMHWTRPSDRQPRTDSPRVAVVGGGPGGLFTTYILNQKLPDARVTIFEDGNSLGGKIRTDKFSDGTPYEAGVAELYEYIGPGPKDSLRALIEDDLGLETVDMSGGGVIFREEVLRDMADVEQVFGKGTRKNIERFHELMAELVPLEKFANRWQPDNAHPWAGKTFKDHLEAEMGHDPVACGYVCAAVHSDLATEPWTCNGLNGIKNVLMDNEKYMRLFHIKGGIALLAKALARVVRADVRLRCRVDDAVARGGGNYRVNFIHDGRDLYDDFDFVFLCLPNHYLSQFALAQPTWGDKGLGEALHRTIRHYDLPAHYLRVSMLFREPFWKRLGMPGDYWMMDCFNGCCAYDESTRWRSKKGHVLSFLLGGQDALLMCSDDQSERFVVRHVLDMLPDVLRYDAREQFVEGAVDRYVGAVNAQPGGWPAKELRGEHQPDKDGHPGVYLVCDAFFDSTLNGVLMSANTAVDLMLENEGIEAAKATKAISELKSEGAPLSVG